MSQDWFAYIEEENSKERHALGTCAEVREQVGKTLNTEWDGDFWLEVDIQGVDVEIYVGDYDSNPDDLVHSVGFVTRGGDPVDALLTITKPNGWVLEELDSGYVYQ